MTPAQARAVAEFAHARTVRSVQEIRAKDAEELKRRIDEMEARQRRTFALLDRQGLWLARIFLWPVVLGAVVEVLVLAWGLWSGEILQAGKYAKGYVLRQQAPMVFWVHCSLHALFATLFGWLAVTLARAAGWLHRRA